MKSKKAVRGNDAAMDSLRAEVERAATGQSTPRRAVIEATDSQLLRVLRRGTAVERKGLLRLLEGVIARGRKVAELALSSEGLGDDATLEIMAFLATVRPDHAIITSYAEVDAALEAGDSTRAADALARLPGPVAHTWARRRGQARLAHPTEALAQLLRESEASATLLLSALGRTTDEATISFLDDLAQNCPRNLRRIIRSTFFRLEQLGVSSPSRDHSPAEPSTSVPLSAAWLSTVDIQGDQAIWIIEQLPEGGTSTLQAIVDDDGALRSAVTMLVRRREADQIEQALRKPESVPTVELDTEAAIGLVERAYARSPTTVSKDYLLWRRIVGAERRGRRLQPVLVADLERTAMVRRSCELLDHVACSSWLLDYTTAEHALELLDKEQTTLVLSPGDEAERVDARLRSTSSETWTPILRRRWSRRLNGAAIFFQACGDQALASVASATADALSGDAWQDIPLLPRLVEKSVQALLEARQREQDKRDDS